jgi:hypothetical protein
VSRPVNPNLKQKISPDLVFRRVFLSVLEEFDIDKQEIAERSRQLYNLDPVRFTTVYKANITHWSRLRRDMQWRTLETMIYALTFPPDPRAFDRFFDLLKGGFDMGVSARAMQQWEED